MPLIVNKLQRQNMIQDFFKWTQLEIRVKETFSKKLEALKEKKHKYAPWKVHIAHRCAPSKVHMLQI